MNESLDIIFTHEHGQIQMTLPLEDLKKIDAFESKKKFEDTLNVLWLGLNYARHPLSAGIPKLRKLVKISTCVYSDSFDFLPEWHHDFDGKFYY